MDCSETILETFDSERLSLSSNRNKVLLSDERTEQGGHQSCTVFRDITFISTYIISPQMIVHGLFCFYFAMAKKVDDSSPNGVFRQVRKVENKPLFPLNNEDVSENPSFSIFVIIA